MLGSDIFGRSFVVACTWRSLFSGVTICLDVLVIRWCEGSLLRLPPRLLTAPKSTPAGIIAHITVCTYQHPSPQVKQNRCTYRTEVSILPYYSNPTSQEILKNKESTDSLQQVFSHTTTACKFSRLGLGAGLCSVCACCRPSILDATNSRTHRIVAVLYNRHHPSSTRLFPSSSATSCLTLS